MTSKKKKIIWFFIIALGLLVIVRVILPYVVLHYLNKTLATMEGYYGHADDIDIALIRGAYTIDSIYLNKLDSTTEKQTPFFGASEIDLSVEWKALFHGSIVGELVFEDALLRFTKDKVEPKEIQSDSSSFKDLLDDFMPLQVNRVEINNGSIQYIDKTSKPPVDIQLSNAYLLAQNLRNSYDSSVVLPASLTAHANIYEGELALNVKLNPLADDPTFDMNAEIKNTNLVRFGLYTEVAAKEGKFAGYVKPLIQDLDVLGKEDRKDNVLRKIWEGLAGTAGEIFENQGKDQVATKVPFEGNLKNPDTNVWYALSSILQNAFIRAIQPSIDQEINIATVDTQKDEKKNLLQKIFGKKDDKDKSKEEEKEKDKKKEDDKKDDNKDKKS
jgi:hypothetical protein